MDSKKQINRYKKESELKKKQMSKSFEACCVSEKRYGGLIFYNNLESNKRSLGSVLKSKCIKSFEVFTPEESNYE